MRIAAVVSVKDEIELIDRCLAHLRTIGVDAIVACDKGSRDGTRERLDQYRADADFTIIDVSDHESHETWAAENLALLKHIGADWVTFLDADEFIVAASGRLADCKALATSDVVTFDRFNVPLAPTGPLLPDELVPDRYDELLVVAEPISDYWDHAEREPETSWMLAKVAARVVARPRCIGTIAYGGHNVFPLEGSAPIRRAHADDAFVAHAPTTTWQRFERKVENIREWLTVQDESFGPSRARHWRRWAAQAAEGSLQEEFDRLIFDTQTIADLRERSVIRSARDLLADRMNAPGAPDSVEHDETTGSH